MHGDFLSSLLFSISVTLPTILMLVLGIQLRRKQMVDDKFCEQATKIVFNITLPVLLFLSIVKNPVDYASQRDSLIVGIGGTLILFLAAEIFAAKFVAEKRERGTFVQGVYRGNNGILGLAFCINAYGEAAFAPGSIYAAALTFVYNILGVITLSRSLSDGKISVLTICKNMLKNPLIIAITAGILFSLTGLQLPKPLLSTGNYLANITLPLALLCTGASINFRIMRNTSQVALWASIGRLLVAPIFMVLLGRAFGLNQMALGIILLMSTTPLAAAAYAMVRGMGGNATTAANIVGITTFGSMINSALGLLILSHFGWI